MVTLIVGLLVFRPIIYKYFNNTPPDISANDPTTDEEDSKDSIEDTEDGEDNLEDENPITPPAEEIDPPHDDPEEDNPSAPPVEDIDPPTNKDDNTDTEDDLSKEESVYATNLVINYTGDLYLLVGQSVTLLDGFISVEPSEMRELVTFSIRSRYNSDPSNVEFDGVNLTANKTGQYNLVFKVPNTDTINIEAKIVLNVLDEIDSTIKQKKRSLEIGSAPLTEYFDINSHGDIRYECSEHLEIFNGNIIASTAGRANINIFIANNNIETKYSFEILIKDKPKYYIEIVSSVAGEILDPSLEVIELSCNVGMYAFGFSVYDINNQKVEQDVSITIDDESLANLFMITDGLVFLDCKETGRVEIRLTFNLDTSVYRTIYLNIEK
ncbi:MAG: hypothetical protein IKC49_01610 [Clostridia bacterium]|nr:hypothetical protein [Clostridia bacterium]